VNAAQDYACYGPYDKDFGAKTVGGGASWHPGKKGHQLRGDVLAFFLLSVLDDALQTIQLEQLEQLEADGGHSVSHQVLGTATHASPAKGKGESGDSATGVVAEAGSRSLLRTGTFLHQRGIIPGINEDIYRVANRFLSKHIGSRGSPAELLAKHPAQWCGTELCGDPLPQCYTNFEPRVSHGLDELVLQSQWQLGLSFFDKAGVQKSLDRGMGYIDRKNIFLSAGKGSKITFYVDIVGQVNDGARIATAPAPAKTPPATTPPAKTDPSKVAPAKTPPAKTDPSKVAPAKTTPAKTPPATTPPAKTDPAKVAPAKTTPVKAAPSKAAPSKPAPPKAESTSIEALAGGLRRVLKSNVTTAAPVRASAKPRSSRIYLCEVQKGFLQYPENMDDLLNGAHVEVHLGAGVPQLKDSVAHNNSHFLSTFVSKLASPTELKLVAFKDYCYATELYLPVGRHVVTLTQKTDKLVNLAYLLFK
jgi:hypothetical protein